MANKAKNIDGVLVRQASSSHITKQDESTVSDKINQPLNQDIRSTVPTPPLTVKQSGKKYGFSRTTLLLAFALVIIGVGGALSWLSFVETKTAAPQVLAATGQSNEEVSETKPDTQAFHSYQVAPDMPRYLRIKSLGIESRVGGVGVNKQGEIGIPANIHDVGWFERSVKPGNLGATLIDGHVSGPTKPGVFKNLAKLNPGDLIDIEKGNGDIVSYKVMSKKTYAADQFNLAEALSPVEPGKNGLNLITCSGKFNARLNSYEQRLLVFATQI